AYVEFSTLQDPDESLPLAERHPNVVLLRTFSKVYGLCGLRVGYGLGSEDFRAAVDRVRQPFSVNALAQAAAVEALEHQDEAARPSARRATSASPTARAPRTTASWRRWTRSSRTCPPAPEARRKKRQ